jgi:Vacuolar protein sorting-associated protein 62
VTPEERQLLERHAPYIQYDSMESFAADSVATMTDCVPPGYPQGNTLCEEGGKVLAQAAPAAGGAKLELDFLRAGTYPDQAHTAVKGSDYIDVAGKAYVEDAREMHVRPGMDDQIYGHAKRDTQGALWLQYWFFYFYNNKAFLYVGLHEGDWEMIQVRLGADGTPDAATYAQHTRGERCAWGEVELEPSPDGPAPVVYSARGSHASYFRRGTYEQAPIVPDYNDAGGPRVRPTVNPIDENIAWVAWPGTWGNTRALIGPIGANSPPGPSHHGAWKDPLAFHKAARSAERLPAAVEVALPETPAVKVRRQGVRAVVSYSFAPVKPGELTPTGLLVSFDGHQDGRPPATTFFSTGNQPGEIEFPVDLEEREYTVRARAVYETGLTGSAAVVELPAA